MQKNIKYLLTMLPLLKQEMKKQTDLPNTEGEFKTMLLDRDIKTIDAAILSKDEMNITMVTIAVKNYNL